MVDIIRKIYDAGRKIDAYSPLFGKCEASTDGETICISTNDAAFTLDKCGRLFPEGKCQVFPGHNSKTWDYWQARIMKPGDIVHSEYEDETFVIESAPDESENSAPAYNAQGTRVNISMKNTRFATGDEKAVFLKDLIANGFSWDGKSICAHRIELYSNAWYVCVCPPDVAGSKYTQGKAYMYVFAETGFRDDNGKVFGFSGGRDTVGYFRPWTEDDARTGDILADKETRSLFICSGRKDDGRLCAMAGVNPVTGVFSRDCDPGMKWSDNPSEPARDDEVAELVFAMHKAHMAWDAQSSRIIEFGVGSKIRYNGEDFRVTGFDDKTIYVSSLEPDDDSPNGISYSADISVLKYSQNELKPFDKVLVKQNFIGVWTAGFFSHMDARYSSKYVCTNGNVYFQCIPYNEMTSRLLGTDEDYDGEYKTW